VSDNKCRTACGGTAKFSESDLFSVENSLPMEKITRWVPKECEFRGND
jgi:hypothetical protein